MNALLPLGCRFSNQPNTWANENDQSALGDHFFKETLRLFYRETNHHTLTPIQASGSMSLRDASCGRDSENWCFSGWSVRMAIEMGLHRLCDDGDEDEIATQGATFCASPSTMRSPRSRNTPKSMSDQLKDTVEGAGTRPDPAGAARWSAGWTAST
ncbi:hypothetical protein JX266_014487, partial [Neoarthrinium moseri]